MKKPSQKTRLIRENIAQTPFRDSEGLFLSSSFTFPDAETAAEKFAETAADYIYSRFSNPTVSALNHRAAILEGGEAALSTASGMAAILATVMEFVRPAIKLYVALTPSVQPCVCWITLSANFPSRWNMSTALKRKIGIGP